MPTKSSLDAGIQFQCLWNQWLLTIPDIHRDRLNLSAEYWVPCHRFRRSSQALCKECANGRLQESPDLFIEFEEWWDDYGDKMNSEARERWHQQSKFMRATAGGELPTPTPASTNKHTTTMASRGSVASDVSALASPHAAAPLDEHGRRGSHDDIRSRSRSRRGSHHGRPRSRSRRSRSRRSRARTTLRPRSPSTTRADVTGRRRGTVQLSEVPLDDLLAEIRRRCTIIIS